MVILAFSVTAEVSFKTWSSNLLLSLKTWQFIFKINISDTSAVKQTQLAENHESNIENEVTSQVPAERERRFFVSFYSQNNDWVQAIVVDFCNNGKNVNQDGEEVGLRGKFYE